MQCSSHLNATDFGDGELQLPHRTLQYRRGQSSRTIFLGYVHVFSWLACCAAVGLAVRDTVTTVLEAESPAVCHHPLLRHARSGRTSQSTQLCRIWTRESVNDLCSVQPWPRLRLLRELELFAGCQTDRVQLAALLNLEWTGIKSEADLRSRVDHLQAADRDCILAPAQSVDCRQCFGRLEKKISEISRAFTNFNRTLYRFDCMSAVDTASATRPFSPNGSCDACKLWYRKWLMVSSLNLWKQGPCLNWCYYAQLTCPHMGTSKVVDYAGHPSFQCKDLHIPPGIAASSSIKSTCSCFHPCDLHMDWQPFDRGKPIGQHKDAEQFDFFPSAENCHIRERVCRKQRDRQRAAEQPDRPGKKFSRPAGSRMRTSTIAATPTVNSGGGIQSSWSSRSLNVSLLLLILLRWPPPR